MVIADLRRLLEDSRIQDGTIQMDFEKGYNLGIKHALMYLDLYERWQEPERGKNEDKQNRNDISGNTDGPIRTSNLQRALRDLVQPEYEQDYSTGP